MSKSILLFVLLSFAYFACNSENPNPLAGKIICIDPGHGGTSATDSFRVGPSGEREEWINLRVALHLKKMLEKKALKSS